MDTRRAVTVVLVAVLLVGAAPALAAVANYAAPIQDEVPVTTDQTPTITLAAPSGADVNLVDMWASDELDIRTSAGNITVSGDPGASARLAVDDIEGTQTQVTQIDAGSAWLELDPADKNRVDVRGDATTLAFSEIGVNDGSTDLQVGGPAGGAAELRLHGLAGNTQYALYDPSRDEVLGTLTTDSTGTGTGTVDLPDGTHSLQVRTAGSFDAPTVGNATPSGQVTSPPDELSVDVTADAWPANVTIQLEGETVHTETVSENGTVTATVSGEVTDLGEYNWSASVTDSVGQTDTVSASFETPSELTIREEHDPQTLVNNSTITVRFFTVDGEIAIERETDDATISMANLPDSEFVVFVEGPDHYDRTIYVESIYNQESIFLLNRTEFPRSENDAIRSRFIFEDLTGDYTSSQTTIQIRRAIDLNGDGESEFMTIAGDYWGASNEYETTLEYGERYQIVLINRETGQRHVAGTHVPTEDLAQTIRVSGLVEEAAESTGVYANAELNASNQQIDIAYNDPAAATENLRVIVEPQGGGDPIFNESVEGPLGTYATAVPLNESQAGEDWVVRFDAGDRHQSAVPAGSGTIGLPVTVPGWLLTFLASMAVTFVGALYGPRTAILGAWSMVFVAAGISMFGWAFSPASVVVAALVATGVTLLSRALP